MPSLHKELVDGGVSLEGYVDVPVCCPSRTSTLSSRYSHNLDNTDLGWCGNFAQVHENHTWIGQLRQAGYATGIFGKYYNTCVGGTGEVLFAAAHACRAPTCALYPPHPASTYARAHIRTHTHTHTHTHSYGEFCGKNVHVPSDFSFAHLMCDDNMYFGNSFNVNGTMQTVGKDVYLTNVIGNSSLAWLGTAAAAAKAGGAPFFAYIAPHAPHVPATPAHEYENAPLPREKAPRTPNWDYATMHHHWLVSEKEPLTPALIKFSDELHARRLRATMSVDDIVAAVFDLLRGQGVLDNTYVIYSACHRLPRAPPRFHSQGRLSPHRTHSHAHSPGGQRATTATTSGSSASPAESSTRTRTASASPSTWRARACPRAWSWAPRW